MCRAGYLGHMNIASLLLKAGADINQRSSDGRTPLMWAAFRNNSKMLNFLLDHGADMHLEDNFGWNAMDLSIVKMNYEAALALKRRGLLPKEDIDIYRPHLWQKYDVDMFLGFLQEDREEIEYPRLFDLIKSKFNLAHSYRVERGVAEQRPSHRYERDVALLGLATAQLRGASFNPKRGLAR